MRSKRLASRLTAEPLLEDRCARGSEVEAAAAAGAAATGVAALGYSKEPPLPPAPVPPPAMPALDGVRRSQAGVDAAPSLAGVVMKLLAVERAGVVVSTEGRLPCSPASGSGVDAADTTEPVVSTRCSTTGWQPGTRWLASSRRVWSVAAARGMSSFMR